MSSTESLQPQARPAFQTLTLIAAGVLVTSVLIISQDPATKAFYERIMKDPQLRSRIQHTSQFVLSLLR
jgi:hypothetical protein